MSRPGGGGGADAPPGVMASLRSMLSAGVSIGQTRLQLLANDLEEQRVRAGELLLFGVMATICGTVTLLLATAFVVVALWDQFRLWTLGIMTVVYAVGGLVAVNLLKARAAERPKMLSATLAELKRDQESLRP